MKKFVFSLCMALFFIFTLKAQKPLEIRDSMLIIGSVYSDTIAKEDLLKIDSVVVLDTSNLTDLRHVTIYNMAFRKQGRYYEYARNYGSVLTQRARTFLKQSYKGDLIVIAGIKYMDADNKEIRFNHAVTIIIK